MSFPNGCHVCEVEIDPATGIVSVVGYAAVDDVGNIVHEVIVDGQTHGGIAQGLGQVLGEHVRYSERRAACSTRRSWITACRAPPMFRS